MPKIHRISGTVALLVCLASTQWSETVFASSEPIGETAALPALMNERSQTQQLPSPLVFGDQTMRAMALPTTPSGVNHSQSFSETVFAQRGWYRGRGRRNGASQAEMVLGAVAAITGAAVLTYANRPACRFADAAGCSYGTKVVGTAVTAAGVVTFLTGALTWR